MLTKNKYGLLTTDDRAEAIRFIADAGLEICETNKHVYGCIRSGLFSGGIMYMVYWQNKAQETFPGTFKLNDIFRWVSLKDGVAELYPHGYIHDINELSHSAKKLKSKIMQAYTIYIESLLDRLGK